MGNLKLINGVQLIPQKIITNPNGDLFHIIKNTDIGFVNFGEAYISTVNFNSIKAWKRHHRMTANFVVPVGCIKIVIFDSRDTSPTSGMINEFSLSLENYMRLTVPPGVFYGFKGIENGLNLLINIADIVHDPLEQETISIEKSEIKYFW